MGVARTARRRAAGVAARRTRALGATRFHFAVVAEARNGVSARDVGQAAVEGAGQGAWAFTELKRTNDDPKPDVEAVAMVVPAAEAKEAGAGGGHRGADPPRPTAGHSSHARARQPWYAH